MAEVLCLKDLCRQFIRGGRSFYAVDHVDLTVNEGDFVTIIGRSGSGKSTLLSLCAGMLPASSGSVALNGTELSGKSDAELSRLRNDGIGYIPQDAPALPALTVLENVMLPCCLWRHGGDTEGAARLLLERFGIAGLADSMPAELSGGELRRAMIARALINRPRLLIADEPTSDLDVENSRAVMAEFARLNAEGLTVLIVSHDLETMKYGLRVYSMESGKLTKGNIFART